MTEKTCTKCKETKSVIEFHTHKRDGYQTWCKACNRIRANAKRLERKAIMDELKNKPCMDCKQFFPPECMDYDHRPGEVKKFEITTGSRRSWTSILEEIAKCDLVCACCHRIRTFARLK